MTKDRFDVHQAVTNAIVAAIEAGVPDCKMPWQRTGLPVTLPKNAATEAHYNGINILALFAASELRGYPISLWGTYKQWQSLGAQVRKGERSSTVVFYKEFEVEPDGDDDDGKRHVAKASAVFNVAQVDGYSVTPDLPPMEPLTRHDAAERFIRATGADIRIGGSRAYYRPSADFIQMPDEYLFRNGDANGRTSDWHSVELHELTHWSGAKHRLAREFGQRFGDDAYAMEELVAELGSAFLCAELGVTSHPRLDHAHYIDSWLKVMKADKRAIFTAAAKASEAARYLAAFSKQEAAHAA